MDLDELVKIIDHTSIWPKASFKDIERLCKEAVRYRFGCVCVNPFYVKYAAGFGIKVGSTCGFPFGANRTEVKVYEAERAIRDGASEIDMVMNIGALKSRKYKIVENDIKGVARLCKVCKVILEMNLLTRSEKIDACRIAANSGADFLKTATGLWGPARISDVRLMARYGAVKASGGIRTFRQVQQFVKAGVARIGTSGGVGIVKDFLENADTRRYNADLRR